MASSKQEYKAVAVATAAVLGTAVLAFGDPSFAAVDVLDADPLSALSADFDVRFLGGKWDHKVIVEWVVLGQTFGFIGSLVGGFVAADRKEEVERLNARLVAVNKQLRDQARSSRKGEYVPDKPVAVPAAVEVSPQQQELVQLLKSGKSLLRDKQGAGAAQERFERALVLSRTQAASLDSPWKAERKALRGLGAALHAQSQHAKALEYMMLVLKISEDHQDTTGVADAIGVIADIYTDKGELDKAGEWYDRYIKEMEVGVSDVLEMS